MAAGSFVTVQKLRVGERTLFVDNMADFGGALAVVRTSDALIDNRTIIKGNKATQGGGGLYWVEFEPTFIQTAQIKRVEVISERQLCLLR